jgi:hypothetical protein
MTLSIAKTKTFWFHVLTYKSKDIIQTKKRPNKIRKHYAITNYSFGCPLMFSLAYVIIMNLPNHRSVLTS